VENTASKIAGIAAAAEQMPTEQNTRLVHRSNTISDGMKQQWLSEEA
jgi:hypothetical protein